MNLGENIGGYIIVSKPTTSGGGQCVWAFAQRGGAGYFIKQFLNPKWPLEDSVGSEAGKRRRRTECLEFEERHRQVAAAVNPHAAGGGNLVTTVDFFRHGTTYYKVTERVEALRWDELPKLTGRQTSVILRTLAKSLGLLHRARLVHGDLKPENVLLQQVRGSELYTAKLIDFDDSYREGEPPPPDQIVGDQTYGAPEWQGYVRERPDITPGRMTTAVDVFAFGLVMHVYLAGRLPGNDGGTFASPGDAVLSGHALEPDRSLHPELQRVTRRMWQLDPRERPTIDDVFTVLTPETTAELRTVPASGSTDSPGSDGPRGSRVRINMQRTPETDARPAGPSSEGKSRVRFNPSSRPRGDRS
jgi:serine/threonine protein kinase